MVVNSLVDDMFTIGNRIKEVIKNINNNYYYGGRDAVFVAALILIVVLILIQLLFFVYSLISSFYCSCFNKFKTKKDTPLPPPPVADYRFSAFFDHAKDDEEADHDDANYAEQLQVQEALLASIENSNPSSSTTHIPTTSSSSSPLNSFLFNNHLHNDVDDEIEQVCNICLENQENWRMFTNSTCPHSFCYECITKHATIKIQQKDNNYITCPEFNCNSALDLTILRLIIPRHVMIKWDEMLCESTIRESHKLYCPYANCSALLINDDINITQIDCPVCKRSICAVCRVPWHSDFTCKEFGKLNSKKKGKKDDKMTQALAKKKKWKKCPKCKFFVEKSEGCLHITCRCNYEFCYRCGAKWTTNHGVCRSRS